MSAPSKAPRRSSRRSINPVTNGNDSVPQRLPRATPRNSTLEQNIRDEAEETPYTNLRQLAGLIQRPTTPSGRPSSIGPSSTKRSARQTSAGRDRTPAGGGQRQTPSRRGVPTTPHALRALQQRRAAALTPGRNRRRSGRVQRETPRDALRNLSRILAGNSKPSDPSPVIPPTTRSQNVINNEIDLDDGPDPPRPRLSLPINEEEDESFEMPAPRLSAPPEDDNNTQRSVEVARRALSEQTGNRYSRGSFGSIRTSDRFSDFNEVGLGIGPEQADVTLGQNFGDSDMVDDGQREDDFDPNDISATRGLQRAFFEEANRPSLDAEDLPDLDEPEESIFEFNVPAQPADVETSFIAPEPITALEFITQTVERPKIIKIKNTKPQSRIPTEAKLSRHGIPCPSISVGVVKKVASTFLRSSGKGKTQLNRDTLSTIMQSTDWFFEQISEDLESYASHAGRKTIDESDVTTLMKRQRQLNANTTAFSLAQRHLPRELIQELRMAPPPKKKGGKVRTIRDEDSDD